MDDNSNDRNFIGRGWSFPPYFDRVNKSVDMTEDEDDINNSLFILLSTIVGERNMNMSYGCNLEDMVFETLDTSTITFIKDKIEKSILFYESRIELQNININTQDILSGLILVEIEYIISATNTRNNYVFPFWREEGTEIQTPMK